ncbi:MAG: hypothetical protein MJE77_26775 [Proteobacteria bacterium]|nr:hypothetical protein [Pseudomonadota bacterium]
MNHRTSPHPFARAGDNRPHRDERRTRPSGAVVLILSLLVVCAGCGATGKRAPYRVSAPGQSPPVPPPTVNHAPASTPAAAATGQASADYELVAPRLIGEAPAAHRPSRPIADQPRRERPGLGTVFGETRTSHVRAKPFVRTSSRPFATVAAHYNDEQGVSAHLAYLGSHQRSPVRAYTPHGGISVALTDPYGNPPPGGAAGDRIFVVGRAGQRYNIVVQNDTGGRYEIVASVDGLDVIDGRPADLRKRGYILEPHATLVIDGFRRSEHHVAAFRFGQVSQSYAARTSGDRNVGVVGIAIFAEHGSPWTSDELHRRNTADPFPGDRSYAQPPAY